MFQLMERTEFRLTTVHFIRIILAVIVTIAAPKLEGAAAIFTPKLIWLTR